MAKRSEPTTQDLIAALGALKEAIDGLRKSFEASLPPPRAKKPRGPAINLREAQAKQREKRGQRA